MFLFTPKGQSETKYSSGRNKMAAKLFTIWTKKLSEKSPFETRISDVDYIPTSPISKLKLHLHRLLVKS
jgi:hypothetical protein